LTPKEHQRSEPSNVPVRSTEDDIRASPSTPTPVRKAQLKPLTLLPIPPVPTPQESEVGPSIPVPAKGTRSTMKRKVKDKVKAVEAVPVEAATTDEGDSLPPAKKQKSGSEGM
jgi:hypothetical protein